MHVCMYTAPVCVCMCMYIYIDREIDYVRVCVCGRMAPGCRGCCLLKEFGVTLSLYNGNPNNTNSSMHMGGCQN